MKSIQMMRTRMNTIMTHVSLVHLKHKLHKTGLKANKMMRMTIPMMMRPFF